MADYTGPPSTLGYYNTEAHQIDLQTYVLKRESDLDGRRSIGQDAEGDVPQARVVALPSVALKDEWDSLVFEDCLPSRLLRILTRMVSMMRQPGLSLAAFNWNRYETGFLLTCIPSNVPTQAMSSPRPTWIGQEYIVQSTGPEALDTAGRCVTAGDSDRDQHQRHAEQVLWRERQTHRGDFRARLRRCPGSSHLDLRSDGRGRDHRWLS